MVNNHRLDARTIIELVALGLVVLVLTSTSVAFTRFDGGAAFLWPASAVLLAVLRIKPPESWPPRLCVAMLAGWTSSSLFGLGPVVGAPIALAFGAEGLLLGALFRRSERDVTAFDSLASVGRFAVVAGLIAPALSGIGGAAAIALGTGKPFLANWWAWYAAHALGNIVVGPFLVLLLRGEIGAWFRHATARCRLEAALLLGFVSATSFGVFAQHTFPILFVPLLPLLIATFRLGRFGAAVTVMLLAVIGGVMTVAGHGPINLIHAAAGNRILFFQFYIGVAALMVLPVAAELKQRELLFLRLQESEATHRLLTVSMGDTISHLGTDFQLRFVSPSATQLSGFDPADLVGRDARDFVHPDDIQIFTRACIQAIGAPETTVTAEYRGETAGAETIWYETRMRAYHAENGTVAGLVLAARDVSRRKAHEAELAQEASTDPLTKLANRRAFFTWLETLQDDVTLNEGAGCVALFDIDFFKRVNDQHGHPTGDAVLKAVARAARGGVRNTDLLARIGGEEFGLVLWHSDVASAARTCERVRSAIAEVACIAPSGAIVRVTASLGIAELAVGGKAQGAYEAADRSLYDAKASGRDCLRIAA